MLNSIVACINHTKSLGNSVDSFMMVNISGDIYLCAFLQSIRYISPAATGILSAFEPLVATLLAVTLLGTCLTLAAVCGSLLILLTTFLQAIPFQKFKTFIHFPHLK